MWWVTTIRPSTSGGGSNVGNIISFADRYDDVRQVPLEENHRSSDAIITLAREFIGGVGNRLPKSMAYADAQQYEPGDITAHEFDDAEDEAQYIARTIRSLHGVEFDDRGKKRGLAWSDMAVLVRIGRHPAGLIAAALTEAGIPATVQWQGSLLGSEEGPGGTGSVPLRRRLHGRVCRPRFPSIAQPRPIDFDLVQRQVRAVAGGCGGSGRLRRSNT